MVMFNSYVTNYQMDPEGICSRIHDFPMEIHLASYLTQRGYPRRVIAVTVQGRCLRSFLQQQLRQLVGSLGILAPSFSETDPPHKLRGIYT